MRRAMSETPTAADAVGPLPHHKLSTELQDFVASLDGEGCSLFEFLEVIGDRGFGLMLLLLAMPAALPVPAAGYATPFGLVMALLGLQIALGRPSPWLPGWLGRRRIPFKLLRFSIKNARLPLRAVELLIRPRLARVARSRATHIGLGLGIALLSLLMSVPLPLTNTAPSFVIFLLAAGFLEEDGLMMVLGMLLAPVAVAIAGAAVYVALTYGPEAVEGTLKPAIKGLLGMSED